ncbi:hypothetical protein [Burkholderia catarinensis]|uniref:hypothetical protein n=1 Tax=Burkholderia catarinensis TaxID=1108140 RepID=UPI0013010CDC|nr:hypothetical protein [Burkholderia catarinensis]
MLDVIVITQGAITAAAVDLSITLSVDAIRATVPPINDHDSVCTATKAIALHRPGAR